MSTGIYVRINREGSWQSIELDKCHEEELKEFFAAKGKDEVVRWLYKSLVILNDQLIDCVGQRN